MPVTRSQIRHGRRSQLPRPSVTPTDSHRSEDLHRRTSSPIINHTRYSTLSITTLETPLSHHFGDMATTPGRESSDSTNSDVSKSPDSFQFTGYEIGSLPSMKSMSSKSSTYEPWEPHDLPDVLEDLVIKEWSQVASGTHGSIREVRVVYQGVDEVVCVKLFEEQWKEEYEREAYAYALMIHRGVRGCIPKVYWKGAKPISWWNGVYPFYDDSDPIYYGLIMEYFHDFREIDFSRIDIPTAEAAARGLMRIHAARVRQGDVRERNILLVRDSGRLRVVWIDFSCAWVNAYPRPLEDEWGSFLADLTFYMDPDVLTDEIYYSRFEEPRQHYFRDGRFDRILEKPTDEVSDVILYPESQTSKELHFAYTSFFSFQLLQFIAYVVSNCCLYCSNFATCSHSSLVYPLSSISLGGVLFSFRNQPLATMFETYLAYMFVIHCILDFASLVRFQISGAFVEGKILQYHERSLNMVTASCSLVWATVGILSLYNRDKLYNFIWN